MFAMTTNKAWDFIHLLRGNLKERWWQLLLTTLCVTYGFLRLSSQWHYWLVALWVETPNLSFRRVNKRYDDFSTVILFEATCIFRANPTSSIHSLQ
jgi:hypothetical protein